jgi:ADP-heptose:LPS heptosyltransferase
MKRYLILQLARFGDLIQTKRLLLSLRKPSVEVHLVVDRSLSGLAGILFPWARIHTVAAHAPVGTGSTEVLGSVGALFSHLGNLDFEKVYSLNFSGLNFSLASAFPPERVRGYRWHNGQPLAERWASMAIRWSGMRPYSGLNLMDFWAGYAPEMVPPEAVNPAAEPRGEGIGVVLAARNPRRSLPAQSMATLAQSVLQSNAKGRLVLLGGPGERRLAKELLTALKPSVAGDTVNLVGKTDWKGLVDVVSGLDLLLTPDTGTMHLAAHLGVPVLAFFLSSAWCFETGPYGEGHRIVQATTDCAPCLETRPCTNGMHCLLPFQSRPLLHFLTGGAAPEVEEVTMYSTFLDGLGVDCHCIWGRDRGERERARFRNLIASHLGLDIQSSRNLHPLSDRLYLERDWMLPPL